MPGLLGLLHGGGGGGGVLGAGGRGWGPGGLGGGGVGQLPGGEAARTARWRWCAGHRRVPRPSCSLGSCLPSLCVLGYPNLSEPNFSPWRNRDRLSEGTMMRAMGGNP